MRNRFNELQAVMDPNLPKNQKSKIKKGFEVQKNREHFAKSSMYCMYVCMYVCM